MKWSDPNFQRIWLNCRKPLKIFIRVFLLLYFDNEDKGFNKKLVGHNKNISPERDTEFFVLLPLWRLSLDGDLYEGRIICWVIRALMTLWKSKNGVVSRVKGYRVRVRRIKRFPFPFDSAYDSVIYDQVKTRLLESEAAVEG